MGVESHDRCWQIWGTSSRCQDLRLASKRRGLSSWRNGGGAIELMLDAYDLLKIFQIYMIHLYEYIYIHNIYIYTDIHILYRVCIYSVYQYARHIWSCVNADLLASCCWSIALGLPPIEQWLLNPGLLFYGLIVFVQQIVYGCLWGYTIQIYWGWSPLILRKIRWTSSVHQLSKTCSICSSELSTHFASEHCRCGNSRRKGKSNSSLPRSAGPRCSSNWKHVITCGYRGCPRPCRFNSSHTHESHLRDSTVPNGYGNLRGWAVHLIILLCGLWF